LAGFPAAAVKKVTKDTPNAVLRLSVPDGPGSRPGDVMPAISKSESHHLPWQKSWL